MTHPAPLDPPAAGLLADLERGLSLPASWYTDAAVAERERERIFRRAWQYVGRTARLAQTGDCLTAVVGEIPVVVVRGAGGLGAFVNVCRHRRHEVVRGEGNRKVLQCPYHAWTYDLEGRLAAAPRCEREAGFDRDELGLLPVRVDTWGPWVFVSPEPGAEPLADVLGDLPAIVAASGVDLARLEFRQREPWVRHANWKVMIENYLECYHCPVAHPGYSAVVDVGPDRYSLRADRWFSSQMAPARPSALAGEGRRPPYDVRGPVTGAQHHFVWPNFTININPGHPNLSLDVWCPDGPGRTAGFSEHYFGPGVPDAWARDLMAFNAQVGAEDDDLTDSVQRGLRGGRPDRGRALLASEALVVHFQKLVAEALG